MKKTELGYPVDFYKQLVSKLKKSSVYTSAQLYDIARDIVKSEKRVRLDLGKFIEKMMTILGNESYEKVVDNSVKIMGRGEKYIFSLKITPEEGMEKIQNHFDTAPTRVRRKTIDSGTKTKIAEKTPIKKKETISVTNKRYLENVFMILKEVYTKKMKEISYKEISTLLEGITVNKLVLERWFYTVKKLGIIVSYTENSSRRESTIKFYNPANDLITLSEKAEKKFGLIFDITSLFGKSMKNPETTKNREEIAAKALEKFGELNAEQKSILWYTAALLYENSNVPMDIHVICKILHDEFGIDKTVIQLHDLLKTNPRFVINNMGLSKISLMSIDGDKGKDSFLEIEKNLSPKSRKHKTLARLGMTLSEVQNYLPESVVVSRIADNDNIFKLVFDESRTSMLMLSLLVMSGRGTDAFFDKEIVDHAKKVIKSADELLKKASPEYRLDRM